MQIRVITPPAPIVTWERAKQHLRRLDDEDRELVEGYIAAATAWLDGPAGWLGRCLGDQVLELTDCGSASGPLPYRPIVEIESLRYIDPSGVEQTLPDTEYRLATDGSLHAATAWPPIRHGADVVRIRYRAGYPDRIVPPVEGGGEATTESAVPTPIVQAVLLLVGQWYATREAVNVGNIVNQMPFAVEALLSPYRVWR